MATMQAFSSARIDDAAEDFNYRPLSTAAIASAVLGLLSTLIFVAGRDSFLGSLVMAPIPLIGIAFGWRALKAMRVHPDEYSGGWLATTGMGLSALCLVGGLAYSGFVYATEVPE